MADRLNLSQTVCVSTSTFIDSASVTTGAVDFKKRSDLVTKRPNYTRLVDS